MRALWTLGILVSVAFPAPSSAFLEKERFSADRTETLKVRLAGDPDKGVLLLKHYKSGSPVFIVSSFESTQVTKTKMVTRERFFHLFETLLVVLPKKASGGEEKNEDCDTLLDVEIKSDGAEAWSESACLDGAKDVQGKLGAWYLHIRDKL